MYVNIELILLHFLMLPQKNKGGLNLSSASIVFFRISYRCKLFKK